MKKDFTLEEANNALSLVRPITRDIRKLWRELLVLRQSKGGMSDEEMRQYLVRLEHHFSELLQIGCIMEDPEAGLVDFPSWHDNLPIELCWKFGEGEILYWHEQGEHKRRAIDANFRLGQSESLEQATSALN